jgi:hypothetical protein
MILFARPQLQARHRAHSIIGVSPVFWDDGGKSTNCSAINIRPQAFDRRLLAGIGNTGQTPR